MTLLERQAKEAADKAAKKEQEEKDKAAAGGIKAPSRLMKPTSASSAALKANEERKQKLLEKANEMKEKMQAKQKPTPAASGAATSRLAKPATAAPAEAAPASKLTGTARSRMALAARQKAVEEKKEGEAGKASSRLGATRKSIGGATNAALASSRIASGRASAMRNADDGEGSSTARTAQGSRLGRSSSKEAINKDL